MRTFRLADDYISILNILQDSDGRYLLAVDEGERHILSVWEWKRQRLITKTTVSKVGAALDVILSNIVHREFN